MSDIPVSEQRVREILARAQYDFARQQKHVDAGFNGGDNLPALNRFRDMVALCEEVLRLRTAQPKEETCTKCGAGPDAMHLCSVCVPAQPKGESGEAIRLLSLMYDKYEDGTDCYEDPEDYTGYLGKAVKLDTEEEEAILAIIPRERAPSPSAVATSSGEGEWNLYQRTGTIEARPWTAEDEFTFVKGNTGQISISPADREMGKVHGLHGGMVARNPDNHADQWYIAATYFAKHYAPPAKAPGAFEGVTEKDIADLELAAREVEPDYPGMAHRLRSLASRLTRGYAAGWQPIETAPTERGSYLCVSTGSPWHEETHAPRTLIAYFDGKAWEDEECRALTVTHWHPIPPAPYVSAESEGA